QSLADRLRASIVFWCTDIDEHSALLKGVYAPINNPRKYIPLEARRAFGNVLEDISAENVDAGVDQTWVVGAGFLHETIHSAAPIDMHGSITPRVLHGYNGHTGDSCLFTLELNQLAEIHLKKRIPVHNQEFRRVLQVLLCEHYGARCTQRLMLSGVLDRHVPRAAVAEFVFDLVRQIAGTHHQPANTLMSKLSNQQFQKRLVANRSQRFGRRRYHRTQASAFAAH